MKTWKIGAASAILVMALVGSTAAVAAGPGGHGGAGREGGTFDGQFAGGDYPSGGVQQSLLGER